MAPPIRRWLRQQRLHFKQEFLVPWGVCDFVGLSFNSENVEKRLALRQLQPIGPLRRLQILALIPDCESGDAISDCELKMRFDECAPDGTFEAELQTLLAGRFIVQTKTGSFQKLNGWVPLHNRLIAVELKLSRISEGIAQAICHLGFANESYLALPAQLAEKIVDSPRVSQFKEKGVGILAVTRTGCRLVLEPSGVHGLLDANLQMHCVERFWRTRDN